MKTCKLKKKSRIGNQWSIQRQSLNSINVIKDLQYYMQSSITGLIWIRFISIKLYDSDATSNINHRENSNTRDLNVYTVKGITLFLILYHLFYNKM